VWDLLSAYADDEVTPEEAARVEQHVAVCADCARDLRFMRQTATVLASTPEVTPPAGLRQAILAATVYRPTWGQRLQASLRAVFLPPTRLRAFGLAGAAAALFGLMLLYRPRPQPLMRAASPTSPLPSRTARRSISAPVVLPLVGRPRSSGAKPSSPALFRTAPPKQVIAQAPRLTTALFSTPPTGSAPRVETPKRATGARAASAPRSNGRPENMRGETPRMKPGLNESMPADPKAPESEPEERMIPDRTMTADATPMPMKREEDVVMPPVAGTPDEVYIKVASASRTMSAGTISSLAELRRTLRRDNEAALANSVLFSPKDRPGMMLAVIKTRF